MCVLVSLLFFCCLFCILLIKYGFNLLINTLELLSNYFGYLILHQSRRFAQITISQPIISPKMETSSRNVAPFCLDSGRGSMRTDKADRKGEVDKREAKSKAKGAAGREPGDIGSACIGLWTPRDSVLAFPYGGKFGKII